MNLITKAGPFKVFSFVLLPVLCTSLFYNYQLNRSKTELIEKVTVAVSEKQQLLAKLKLLNEQYDSEISKCSILSDELLSEQDRVKDLIAKINQSNNDTESLQKFKSEYSNLTGKRQLMQQKIDSLTTENITLIADNDIAKKELLKTKKLNDTLSLNNLSLQKKVLKATKINAVNLTVNAFKQKSDGQLTITDKANKTNLLNISFTLAENLIARPEYKTYYVQVIDANNNVLGEKNQKRFGDNILSYSFEKKVDYRNATITVSEDFPVLKMKSGMVYVNVFDQGKLILKSSIDLKSSSMF